MGYQWWLIQVLIESLSKPKRLDSFRPLDPPHMGGGTSASRQQFLGFALNWCVYTWMSVQCTPRKVNKTSKLMYLLKKREIKC
jgi:hypothetical protein